MAAALQMNQTLDYSFENTPVSSQQANGSQVPTLPKQASMLTTGRIATL